jgi:hypothetical protein
MPGIVQSFDASTQLATVQPAIRRIFITRDGDKETLVPDDLPILINVPVIFPRGGGFSLTFPVRSGDECLLVFCERSIDDWHETGKVKAPTTKRFHSLSDATAIVGISSLTNKVPDYDPVNTEIKKDDGSVSITLNNDSSLDVYADSNISIDTPADIIANCNNMDVTASSNITANCNNMDVTASSNITANCNNIDVTASGSATLTSPVITLNGNTTINGTLDVSGATTVSSTLDVSGATTVSSNLAVAGTSTAPTVSATTSLKVSGKEMKNHKHGGSPTAPSGVISDTGAPV